MVAAVDPIKLRMACTDGNVFVTRYLLERGADAFAVDPYDGRNALMTATHYGHADVVAVVLMHLHARLTPQKLYKGLSAVDHAGCTVHEIAVTRDAAGCLSVLLYHRGQAAAFEDDAAEVRGLLDLSVACGAHKVEDLLRRRYFADDPDPTVAVADDGDHGARLDAAEALKRTALCYQDEYLQTSSSNSSSGGGGGRDTVAAWLRRAAGWALRLCALLPKRAVFVSMRITIAFSLYMAVTSDMDKPWHVLVMRGAAHLFLVASMAFMWCLYSKVCVLSPGACESRDSWRNPPAPIAATAAGTTVSAAAADVGGRRRWRSYEEALELLRTTSAVAGKSPAEAVKQLAAVNLDNNTNTTTSNNNGASGRGTGLPDTFSFHAPDLCCHVCRLYRPWRSFHSRVLNRCVPHSDHYCVFLENTVGRDNYPLFVAALCLAVFVTLPLFVAVSAVYLTDHPLSHHIARGGTVSWVRALASARPLRSAASWLLFRTHYVFALWCTVWWCCFALLLGAHTYLMAYNLTSKEFVQGSDAQYISKGKGSAFARPTVWGNVRDRLFPLDDDVCYCKRDVADLLARPLPPTRHYTARFWAALWDVFNDRPVQRWSGLEKEL